MTLPAAFINSLEGLPGFDRDRFEAVHAAGDPVTSIRLNPGKLFAKAGYEAVPELTAEVLAGLVWDGTSGRAPDGLTGLAGDNGTEHVPWSSFGYYLPRRPSFTSDPRFHAGVYYVQEASSMFLEQALRQTADAGRPLKVLDLCAAPGGKSTLLQSLLPADSLLVSNEVIRNRVHILEENIVKWGALNTVVTSSDPKEFGKLENYFDVIVVDAPCSGSGLFRREPEAIGEWSPDAVRLCSQRQQRILADCWPALKQDGVLIYSTCSYSREEDEDIAGWIGEGLGAESIPLKVPQEWQVVETAGTSGGHGYRFYSDRLRGEGFYLSCLRKQGGASYVSSRKKGGIARLGKKEESAIGGWIRNESELSFFGHGEFVHAIPQAVFSELPVLRSACRLVRAGVRLGKLSGTELIPAHDLAVCVVVAGDLPAVDLSRDEALRYLRKDEISPGSPRRGWMLARYGGFNLGWIKVLPGRINNYYPKEWRILRREP